MTTKQFGFKKNITKDRKYYLGFLNKTFFVLVFFSFVFFAFYSKITNLIFDKDKVDIFKEDMEQIAFYFKPFDEKLSDFLLQLDSVSKDYIAGKNILHTREKEIDAMWQYMKENKYYLTKLGFAKYDGLINFISKLRGHKDEIFDLLGKDKTYNYLVILQNTNEKRPNGGFFGSFAFITVSNGHLIGLEIVDSYYPDYIAYKTFIDAPEWSNVFLPEKRIGFLSANKFGFTDIDGKNIKLIYEKAFNETYDMEKVQKTIRPDLRPKLLNKNIKGVIFVRSDFFELVVPNLKETLRERQFTNACVDLIRGETRGNKKELYIKKVTDYFNNNKGKIAKNIINNFQELLDKKMINIYLSNVSVPLHEFLKKSNLNTIFSSGNIYSRDSNNSFNKSDGFVTKNIQIFDSNGKIVVDETKDILDIKELHPGEYTMKIFYNFNVSDYYKNFIYGLQDKYGIKITEREERILAIKPAQYEPDKILKRWETNSTLYFPQNIDIISYTGDLFDTNIFYAPFADGLSYHTRITENNKTKTIEITFKIK